MVQPISDQTGNHVFGNAQVYHMHDVSQAGAQRPPLNLMVRGDSGGSLTVGSVIDPR